MSDTKQTWLTMSQTDRDTLLKGFGPFDLRKRAVFLHAGPNPRWRYIPKALGPQTTGWRTWDRREQKFLSDAELVAVPVDDIFCEEFTS
jgi:hypothetical protein